MVGFGVAVSRSDPGQLHRDFAAANRNRPRDVYLPPNPPPSALSAVRRASGETQPIVVPPYNPLDAFAYLWGYPVAPSYDPYMNYLYGSWLLSLGMPLFRPPYSVAFSYTPPQPLSQTRNYWSYGRPAMPTTDPTQEIRNMDYYRRRGLQNAYGSATLYAFRRI